MIPNPPRNIRPDTRPALPGRDFWDDLWHVSTSPIHWRNFLVASNVLPRHLRKLNAMPSFETVRDHIVRTGEHYDTMRPFMRAVILLAWGGAVLLVLGGLQVGGSPTVAVLLATLSGFFAGGWFVNPGGAAYRAKLHALLRRERTEMLRLEDRP